MPFKIKVRLLELGKKQCDLIPELRKRGFKVDPAELSKVLSGTVQYSKAQEMLSASNEIVSEWERTSLAGRRW